MPRQSKLAPALLLLTVGGVLAAAAFSGASEARPFAANGSLECPPFDIGQPISDFERTYGVEHRRRAASHFVEARTSMSSARRAEIEALEVLRTFEQRVAGAEGVVTGTISDQRLAYMTFGEEPTLGLVSALDDGHGVRVVHPIWLACHDGSAVLAYMPSTPALETGHRYAIVVGAQMQDSTRPALLAYELDGDKITEYWLAGDSPVGGGSILPHLFDAIEN